MALSARYYITAASGSYFDLSYTIPGFGSPGQQFDVRGGAGADWVYAPEGSTLDFSQAGTGNDLLYMTGNFADYSQSVDDTGVYTFTRNLPDSRTETIKFKADFEDDAVYFADGHVMLNLDNSGLLDENAGSFRLIEATDMQPGGTPSYPLASVPAQESVPTKIYIFDAAGFDVPMLPVAGQAAIVFGGAGEDRVYVNSGTSIDFSQPGTGNDKIYLTGRLSDYSQSIVDNVYTLTRISGLLPGHSEVVKFISDFEDDYIYFANGYINLNAEVMQPTGTSLMDPVSGVFRELALTDLDGAFITPGLDDTPPDTPTMPGIVMDNAGPVTGPVGENDITDDDTPSLTLVVAPGANETPVLVVDGVVVAATYNSSTHTLTPTVPISDGTHTIAYRLKDEYGNMSGDSPAVSIIVEAVNETPVAMSDTDIAVETGTSPGSNAGGNVLINDTDIDAGDTKTVSAVAGGTVGTVGTALSGNYGSLTLSADGSYTYVVNNSNATVNALRTAGSTLTETFTYTMQDAAGATSAATLTITIYGANDAPVAVADAGTALEAGAVAGSNATGNVLSNDTDVDSGDSKTVSVLIGGSVGIAASGTYGSLTLNANGSYSYAVNNSNATVNALRTSSDTLAETFTYTMRDTAGATSTTTLTITIQGANDAPVAVADTGTAVETGTAAGSNASGNVLTNDTDVDSGDTKTVSALTGGTLGTALAGTYGSLTLNADGSYSYAVNNSNATVNALRTASDTLVDTFTYTVRDTAGATSTATVSITIQGANDAPAAVADAGTAVEAGTAAGSNASGNVLSNDTDVDSGDTKTVSALTGGTLGTALAGTYGSLTLNADGSYSYAVNNSNATVNALRTASDTLIDTFTYTMQDAAGATSTATLSITIQGANDAPAAVADSGTAVEAGTAAGSNASGNVLTNDTDVDSGDTKAVSALTGGTLGTALAGTYGSLTLNADGSYSYAVNNSNATVNALRTSGDTLTETFTYTMRDAAGATSTATLTVTIQGANDAPSAVADTGTAVEAGTAAGSNASGNVLSNDTDVDTGDTKTVAALTGGTLGTALAGTYGSLTLNADGSYSYAVNNSNATVNALRTSSNTLIDTFTYTMRDAAGATSTATVSITIQGANDAPVAVADTGTAVEQGTAAGSNASGNVLSNDTDVDTGDARTVSALTGGTLGTALAGTYGSLTLNADGSYSYAVNNSNATVNALRTSSNTLIETFTYTMRDAVGATSTATLSITIQGANDAPVAIADAGTAVETGTAAGSNASGNVLSNDTDVDSGDTKTVSALTGGTVGAALAGSYGSLTLNADGSYSYAVNNSNATVNGLRTASDTLTTVYTYTTRDTAGATSTATLTITIQGANDAPVAVADSGTAVEQGTAASSNASGNVLTNDTDVDSGDTKTVSALTGGTVGTALAGAYGSLTLNANGSYSYAVNNSNATVNALRTASNTLTETFTYTMQDTAGATSTATLTITIQGANDAPVAVADTAAAAGVDPTGNVLSNDTDVDSGDTKTVSALAGGTVGVPKDGSYGSLMINGNGNYIYVVNNANPSVATLGIDVTLIDTFTYTVRDTAGATSTATLTVTISGVNDAPVAVDDVGTAVETGTAAGSNASGNVLTNDTDADSGDTKTVSALTGGTVGTALAGTYGSLTLNADGSYSYTVNNSNATVNALRTSSNTLTEIFTYTMQDSAGATSTATLTITIQGANDAPVAVADTGTAVETGTAAGSNASGNVLTNDTDVDSGDTKTISALTGGTLGTALAGTYGSLTLNADGSYSYAVNDSNATVNALRTASDTLIDTFTYTVRDTPGATSTATVSITIQGANDAPAAVADSGTAVEAGTAAGSNASGNVLSNDTDVDSGDVKTVSALAGGTVGTALAGAYGSLTLNADGSYSYAVNNSNATVNALRTSSDTLTETFTYTMRDTAGATSTATLTITIQGANDAPVAVADTGTAVETGTAAGSNASGNVLTNDTDVDSGDTKTVSALTGGTLGTALAGTYGSLTLNADGSYSYAVNNSNATVNALRTASDTLVDTFTYTVRDTAGATSTATVSVTIQGANDAPVAVADTGTAVETGTAVGSNASGNVMANDTDVDSGDTKTVSALTGGTVGTALAGSYGSLTLNADGSYSYAVNDSNATVNALRTSSDTLTETFTYTMHDSAGATSTATLSVTIQGANDAPVLTTPIADQSGSLGQAITSFSVASSFSDVDAGDTRSYSFASGAPAWLSINASTGQISGTPTADGNYDVTVIATDAAGATASDTFTLAVQGTPQLLSGQAIDNVANLDVGSAIVLTFSQNISLGSGQIRIMDDMGTNGWIVTNPTTGESKQDVYDNDVVLTLTNGVITGFTVGGVDKSASMAGSLTVSGNKLIINPSGDHSAAGNNTWNFDWDFGANYHIELGAGVVVGSGGNGNAAVTDPTALNFTTVTPVANATGAASQKMNTSSGALQSSYIWHSAHVSADDQGAYAMNFSGGAHALVVESNGGATRQTSIGGKVSISNFGIEGGVVTADDLLYNDNLGNMSMATTDGAGAGQWALGKERYLSNSTAGYLNQRVIFDTTSFPGTWSNVLTDTAFENTTHYNANVIVFG